MSAPAATTIPLATKTNLDGVLLLRPPFAFDDSRGCNIETFHQLELEKAGIPITFLRDSLSISKQHVLRGLHGDTMTWKLVTCLAGELFFVALNMDRDSPQYMHWQSFTLSEKNRLQVLVPPKFANGHLVLSDRAHFFYKMSHDHDRSSQFTVAWNSPTLAIDWPVKEPIVSDRDAGKDPSAPVQVL